MKESATQEPITKGHKRPRLLHEKLFQTNWQKRMLPLMKWMVTGLTFFFFIASFAQFFYLQRSIERAPTVEIRDSFSNIPNSLQSTIQESIAVSRFKALVMLENNALERRHHQANVLLMSRVWVRYLGFVTGMILALVGAAFILGKLQEPASELGAKVEITEFKLKSSSPGIILATLGVVLMLTTIVIHHEIEVKDSPIYTRGDILSSTAITESKKPQLDK